MEQLGVRGVLISAEILPAFSLESWRPTCQVAAKWYGVAGSRV